MRQGTDGMRAYEAISTTTLLQKAMSIHEERHRVIANNIANLGTPGYRPVDIDFHKTLDRAVSNRDVFYGRVTKSRHIPIVQKRPVVLDLEHRLGGDGGGVDIDYEMGELTKNTVMYNTYAAILRKRFQLVANMLRGLR